MEILLKGGKLLTRVIARDKRKDLLDIENGLSRITQVVDDFYERLGPRNWIFHDNLPLDEIDTLLGETSDPEAAESRLIDLYRDRKKTKWWMTGLRSHDGLRVRCHQIERAHEHYRAGHFNSCTLQLIAVMDGFVNDFEPAARTGLSARDPEDMAAWDSVVGHHNGLTHVMKTFTKTIKKRIDEEVYDVYRHGIMHGSVVNFDNVIVATKAWNLLYSVADWAKATEKAATPKDRQPTFRESVGQLARNIRYRKRSDEFVPWTLDPREPDFASNPAAAAATDFLEAWCHKRWQLVVPFMSNPLPEGKSDGQAAKFVKETFDTYPIDDYMITNLTFDAVSSIEIRASATVAGELQNIQFRMLEWTVGGSLAMPGDEGTHWSLAVSAPRTFFQ